MDPVMLLGPVLTGACTFLVNRVEALLARRRGKGVAELTSQEAALLKGGLKSLEPDWDFVERQRDALEAIRDEVLNADASDVASLQQLLGALRGQLEEAYKQTITFEQESDRFPSGQKLTILNQRLGQVSGDAATLRVKRMRQSSRITQSVESVEPGGRVTALEAEEIS